MAQVSTWQWVPHHVRGEGAPRPGDHCQALVHSLAAPGGHTSVASSVAPAQVPWIRRSALHPSAPEHFLCYLRVADTEIVWLRVSIAVCFFALRCRFHKAGTAYKKGLASSRPL